MKTYPLHYSVLKLTLLFISLSILSSCTFEKRRYNSGYHVERKNNKTETHSSSNAAVSIDANAESAIESKISNTEKASALKNQTSEHVAKNVKVNIGIVKNKNNSTYSSEAKLINKTLNPFIKTTRNILQNKIKLTNKNTASISSPKPDNSGSLILSLGLGFILGGFLVFWFISILTGLLFMILGLIFVIAGAIIKGTSSDKTEKRTEKKEENNKSGQYVDVVYIKNGSIIKGIIIEQIPNVQIKIQTKDGSIFVYKMDEIERITKEQE